MTVQELMAELAKCDPNARVSIMAYPETGVEVYTTAYTDLPVTPVDSFKIVVDF